MSAQPQTFVPHSVTEVTEQTSSLQQAERALWRRLQESEALAAIGRALNETLELERILQLIVEAVSICTMPHATIWNSSPHAAH